MPRPGCYECLKASTECICGIVPRIANRTIVHILQHPRERFHAIGTARIARLGLERVRLEVAPPGLAATRRFRGGVPPEARLLFPDPQAPELAALPAAARPRDLVVLDGTWREARALLRQNRWLSELPRARLSPSEPSRYRIRRAPRAQYVSTVEAVVLALRILEPDTADIDGLIAAFDQMIERQIWHEQHAGDRPPRRRLRSRGPRRPSRIAQADAARIVLVYGEFLARATASGPAHDVILWAAERVASDETFSFFARPGGAGPDVRQLANMGLTADRLAEGGSQDELRRAWERFSRPGDVVAAWNQSTFARFEESRPLSPDRLLLKAAFCNVSRRVGGHLEDEIEALGLQPPAPRFPGRTGRRMACARAMFDHMRATAVAG